MIHTNLQSRNRPTDLENDLVVARGNHGGRDS